MRVLTICIMVGFAFLPALATDWPRFRGPNGTGVSADKNVPVEWTAKNIQWKVPLPGTGNSSPVVWGERLFVQSSAADGSERTLHCLNTADGKEVWKQSIRANKAKTHAKSSLASSTPATDGERIYVMFWDGDKTFLHAYDFDGNKAWDYDLGKYESQHGAGQSPIVHDGLVILANDHDSGAILVALHAKSGKLAWDAKRKHYKACYSGPFVIEADGKPTQLVVASTTCVTGYELKTGKVIWNYEWAFDTAEPLRTVGSPIASQNLVFVTSGTGGGDRRMLALKADSMPDNKGDITKTGLVWENQKSFPYVPTLLAQGDYLFFVHDKGLAGCYVAKTGEEVWNKRIDGNYTASPILIDGKVYACSEEGDVTVFAAAKDFKLFAKNSLGEMIMASPAVANDQLYIRGKKHLFRIGK